MSCTAVLWLSKLHVMYISKVYMPVASLELILLSPHQGRVITSEDNEDVQRLHIRRSHVFLDALRQFSKRSFDVSKMLQVRFVGEQAVDEGGPRREFFYLLTHEIFKSSFLLGFLIMLFQYTMSEQWLILPTTPSAR